MNKFMRLMVFFDLPVTTPTQRKVASKFRRFLLGDGYYMMQFSIYARICNGIDAVDKHKKRLYASVPDNGSVRLLVITEKQYESIEILVGDYKSEEKSLVAEQSSLY